MALGAAAGLAPGSWFDCGSNVHAVAPGDRKHRKSKLGFVPEIPKKRRSYTRASRERLAERDGRIAILLLRGVTNLGDIADDLIALGFFTDDPTRRVRTIDSVWRDVNRIRDRLP